MTTDCPSGPAPSAISRRSLIGGLATAVIPVTFSALAPSAAAEAIAMPATPEDTRFMREAIALAAQADYPFGAVIVRDGVIQARGLNLGKHLQDPTAHGEMVAIRRFLAERGPQELRGTTLYTSGEPCVMCMGAIVWCGISRVVFAASVAQIAAFLDQIMISSAEVANKTPSAKISITGGVLAEEAVKLFHRPKPKP